MDMIRGNLPATYTKVWFNAWKYDKDEMLWRAFLTAVLNAMKEKAKQDGEPTEAFEKLQSLLYRSMEFEKLGGVKIDLAKLGGAFAKGAVNLSLSFIPGMDALQKLTETLLTGAGKTVEESADAISRERTKVFVAQIASLEQFQKEFQELVQEQIAKKGGRLVVFVDDLDRCLPEKTIEVLEAIKLFMDAKHCVFILGLDDKVVARAIENKYRELGNQADGSERVIEGANYLEKIIQLPFSLPTVERAQMDKFVGKLVAWEDEECPKVFALGLGSNPRKIKRAVNSFLMLSSVAQEKHNNLKPLLLAKVVTIQNVFPELYQKIAKDSRRYLKDLEEYFRAKLEPQKREEQPAALEISEREDSPSPSGRGVRGEGAIEPPPELKEFFTQRNKEKTDAIGLILTMHPREMKEASFVELMLDEIDPYFTLTARAEAPVEAAAKSAPQASQAERSQAESLTYIEPQMVRIPAGEFLMGSEEYEDEKPPHKVTLDEYYIGKYPVTNREYQAFVKETRCKPPQHWEGENYPPEKAEHPVTHVSWRDAMAYCQWLSEKTKKQYRLPSEAEWEKAARWKPSPSGRGQGEGEALRYPWGNDFDPKKCNSSASGIKDTSEVGRFSPSGDSPYGCADMAGNVWEWCHSLYKPYSYDVKDGREDEKADGDRMLRGGSWGVSDGLARASGRFIKGSPTYASGDVGFRCSRSP